jgi:hypothetical protein
LHTHLVDFSQPDKHVSILSTGRAEIIHDFSGAAKKFFPCHPGRIFAVACESRFDNGIDLYGMT